MHFSVFPDLPIQRNASHAWPLCSVCGCGAHQELWLQAQEGGLAVSACCNHVGHYPWSQPRETSQRCTPAKLARRLKRHESYHKLSHCSLYDRERYRNVRLKKPLHPPPFQVQAWADAWECSEDPRLRAEDLALGLKCETLWGRAAVAEKRGLGQAQPKQKRALIVQAVINRKTHPKHLRAIRVNQAEQTSTHR